MYGVKNIQTVLVLKIECLASQYGQGLFYFKNMLTCTHMHTCSHCDVHIHCVINNFAHVYTQFGVFGGFITPAFSFILN